MGLGGFVVATWRVAPLVFWAPVGPAARELSAPCVVACGSAGVPGVGGPGRWGYRTLGVAGGVTFWLSGAGKSVF